MLHFSFYQKPFTTLTVKKNFPSIKFPAIRQPVSYLQTHLQLLLLHRLHSPVLVLEVLALGRLQMEPGIRERLDVRQYSVYEIGAEVVALCRVTRRLHQHPELNLLYVLLVLGFFSPSMKKLASEMNWSILSLSSDRSLTN